MRPRIKKLKKFAEECAEYGESDREQASGGYGSKAFGGSLGRYDWQRSTTKWISLFLIGFFCMAPLCI